MFSINKTRALAMKTTNKTMTTPALRRKAPGEARKKSVVARQFAG